MQPAIAVCVALLLMTATAQAQAPATTFAELTGRLATGETVFVTNSTGQAVKGRVRQVSDTVLVLRSGSDELTLAASDVQRVVRRGHTLRKGALIAALTAVGEGRNPGCPG